MRDTCPNCNSADYHQSWGHQKPRCNFCGYDSSRPDIRPKPNEPMRRVNVNSPEWKAEVKAYVEAHGYSCCGSKVVNVHTADCPEMKRGRSSTWGT